jgi:organic hydroperoxide reductase OsmC/OhrA
MSEHIAHIAWERTTSDFQYDTYDRTHTVLFEGGTSIKASSAPEFKGEREKVNPEEMLAASASACHMLTFLALAARSRITVNSYTDRAVAHLGKAATGRLVITKIDLHPKIEFEGTPPTDDKLKDLHEKAHRNCFIAGSLNCPVDVID